MHSSLNMAWRQFSTTLILSCCIALTLLYALILIIDPYDSVSFSPNWDRYPVSRHSRDYNAVLARRLHYDSAVVGTSTSMLLHPDELSQTFGGRFVMLSMPAASPFEQMQLLRLFHRHHPKIHTLLIGLDGAWCDPNGAPRHVGLMVNQQYPAWLYDERPWGTLPPLDQNTIDDAGMQLRALLGLRIKYERKPDGYWDFTNALHKDNDPESIHRRLYNEPERQILVPKKDDGLPAYPDLNELEAILSELSPETSKILFFSPYHHVQLPESDTDQMATWQNCKDRAAAIVARVPGTTVVDFMVRSRITEDDNNYIDGHHYRRHIASELVRMLSDTQQGSTSDQPEFRVLARSRQ
jgi:hypothetical protein